MLATRTDVKENGLYIQALGIDLRADRANPNQLRGQINALHRTGKASRR